MNILCNQFLVNKRETKISFSFIYSSQEKSSFFLYLVCSSSFDVINCASFVILLKKIKHSTNLFVQCHLFYLFFVIGFPDYNPLLPGKTLVYMTLTKQPCVIVVLCCLLARLLFGIPSLACSKP
jgi:hypothetical protein